MIGSARHKTDPQFLVQIPYALPPAIYLEPILVRDLRAMPSLLLPLRASSNKGLVMDQTPPIFVSVFFTVIMIGTIVGLLALFISGVLLSFKPEVRNYWDDDDEGRGGDEGFTPAPWEPSPEGIEMEEHEEELVCQ